jgi:hypothetical protein
MIFTDMSFHGFNSAATLRQCDSQEYTKNISKYAQKSSASEGATWKCTPAK